MLCCRFFEAGACELRIGVYESFDTLCIYLESDALASPERNFWVKYRIAVVNQRHPDRTEWKDSAICTKTWNNSVLQFMKVSAVCSETVLYEVQLGCLSDLDTCGQELKNHVLPLITVAAVVSAIYCCLNKLRQS